MNRKKRLVSITFAINGFLFLMGGLSLIFEDKIIFGMIQLLASMLNILMIVKIRSEKPIVKLNLGVLVMNVIVCISIALDNMLADTSYIQYAWIVAAMASLVAFFIQIKRKKSV